MNYRRDIDGLRAIAILPVILFHAGYEHFSGGFVGVDVFFVISGYLIGKIVIGEVSENRFSVLKFYERRARRILPALFFMILMSLPFAWAYLLPDELIDFGKSLIYIPAFLSNVLFNKQSGYFDIAAELKPMLHTWSLSTEEQYYLIFPILVILIKKTNKNILFTTLLILGIASLIYAEITLKTKPSAAFYLLPSRAWELICGALAAQISLSKKTEDSLKNSYLQTIGLTLIIIPVFLYDKETVFPGINALPPTLGTLLLLLFPTNTSVVNKILESRVSVGIGLLSYSLYLWHQPVLALARQRSIVPPDDTIKLLLLGIVFFASYLSWRYIEKPFRDPRRVSRRLIFSFSVFFSIAVSFCGYLIVKNDGFNGRFQRGMLTSEKNPQFNGEKTCSEDFALEKSAGPCIYRHTDTTKSRANKIAVFGDSHSYSLSPIFIDISKTTNRQIVHMGLGGCPPLIGIDVVKGNYPLGTCTALVERQLQLAQQGDISTVILVGRWSLYTNGSYEGRKRNYFLSTDETKTQSIESSTEAFKKGFERTLDTYSKMGIKVVIVEQAPMQTVSPGRIYARLATDDELSEQTISSVVSKYSVGWEKHELFQQKNRTIIRELVGRYQSSIVSFDEIFCDEKACLLGDNKNAYYTDFDHLSAYGAMKVKEKLTEKLLEK